MGENTDCRRLCSLDALRGFDMLFIIGLDQILRAVAGLMPKGAGSVLWNQMGHVDWQGLSVYDLIFPLFVFISGASMRFSFARARERGIPRSGMVVKLWIRAALLAVLGVLVNVELIWGGLSNLRYASVLGLIGISCALAGCVALLWQRWWQQCLAALCILGFVGVLQCFGGDMSPSGCVNAHIDALLCPGRLHLGVLDPEGPLCIVSATALCLCGFLAGEFLAWSSAQRRSAYAWVAAAGGGALLLSLLCTPVIKNIWTPAFVMVAAGVGCLLLALFHVVFDAPKRAGLGFPLYVVGRNALFIYLLTHVLPFGDMVQYLFGKLVQACVAPAYEPLCMAVCYLLFAWLICLYLWKRRIFIKA